MKNKKGVISDLFVFMIVAFVLVIFTAIMMFGATKAEQEIYNNIDVFQDAVGEGNNASEIVDQTFGRVPDSYEALKWINAMLIIGMFISILVHSYLVRIRPVFMVPYILVTIIAIIVSVPLSNVYEQLYENPTLASTFTGFFGQTYIFLNLPIWITIIGLIGGLIMFVNIVKQGQYGGYE